MNKLCEELNGLYSSPDIAGVIKPRKMRWAGHVACMGIGEVYTGFWWENLRGRSDLEDPDLNRRIILRWILRKWDVRDRIDVAQDRDRWKALVHGVMNLRIPYNAENVLNG
jgi:hypothetical protein